MSLQGTLDTFGVPDVLALLSGTKKKGELKIHGPGFVGSVWIDDGRLVGAEVPRCPTLVDAVFELMRLPEGEFAFEGDSPVRSPMPPESVGDVLGDAEERIVEWRDIAIHIPSAHMRLQLAPAAPSSQVVLDPDQWRLVVASGHGVTLAELADAMELSEFQICRTAKALVENGLATAHPVTPPPAPAAASAQAPVSRPDAAPAQAEQPAPPPPAPEPEPAQASAAPTVPPPAPEAAPTAPAAETPPPVVVEEEDPAKPGEPVDRSALLKFLSSVRN